MSSLMSYLFKKLRIKIKTVGPYNHQSLQAEHNIKSLSNILTKHLTGQGQTWHNFVSLAPLLTTYLIHQLYAITPTMSWYFGENQRYCWT